MTDNTDMSQQMDEATMIDETLKTPRREEEPDETLLPITDVKDNEIETKVIIPRLTVPPNTPSHHHAIH
jgi:hypothetical protein